MTRRQKRLAEPNGRGVSNVDAMVAGIMGDAFLEAIEHLGQLDPEQAAKLIGKLEHGTVARLESLGQRTEATGKITRMQIDVATKVRAIFNQARDTISDRSEA